MVKICSCNSDSIRAAMSAAVRKDGVFYFDQSGRMLFLEDANGFRSQIPGECDQCYNNWKQKHYAARRMS